MSERTIITCNECGLEKGRHEETKGEAWVQLKNIDMLMEIQEKVRVKTTHHFCSFGCLNIWSGKAAESASGLVQLASGTSPRGTFTNDDLGLEI